MILNRGLGRGMCEWKLVCAVRFGMKRWVEEGGRGLGAFYDGMK